MANLKTGTIHNFTPSKGYGFIEFDGTTFFFHKNSVDESILLTDLTEGQEVSFRFGKNDRGACAVGIQWATKKPVQSSIRLKKKKKKAPSQSHELIEITPQKWHEQFMTNISNNQQFKNIKLRLASTSSRLDKENISIAANKAVEKTKTFAVTSLSFAGKGLLDLSKRLEKQHNK